MVEEDVELVVDVEDVDEDVDVDVDIVDVDVDVDVVVVEIGEQIHTGQFMDLCTSETHPVKSQGI